MVPQAFSEGLCLYTACQCCMAGNKASIGLRSTARCPKVITSFARTTPVYNSGLLRFHRSVGLRQAAKGEGLTKEIGPCQRFGTWIVSTGTQSVAFACFLPTASTRKFWVVFKDAWVNYMACIMGIEHAYDWTNVQKAKQTFFPVWALHAVWP